jgi:tetratricopeptide (TPR) repeat protein
MEGNRLRKIERIVAGRDDLLDALFERTYARLSPAAKRVFLILCNWRSLVAHLALDAALLRPTQVERIDIPAALEDLRRVSFIDEHVSPKDGRVFLSVPLVGSVFGKRKLSVFPDRVEIESDTRFLQRFGPMQPSDVQYGIEPRIHRFFRSLSEELGKGKLGLASERPVLELIARSYPPAWLMIADLWREAGTKDELDEVKSALSRYIEAAPPADEQRAAWERIAAIERQRNNWFEFVNAQVHIAELPEASLATISSVVNTFNSVIRHLESDAEARMAIARRLAAVMEPKIAMADATDCSRLAWVLIHSGRTDRALEIIDSGLRLEPTNEYCRKLKAKVWERIAEKKRLQGDVFGFLEAAVRMVEVPGTDIAAISSVANDFNQLVRQLDADPEAQRELARRLSAVMELQIPDGDAVDCSRLAWVMAHAGRMDGLLDVVERGLRIDPQSEYCLNLKAKFGPTAGVR